MIYAIDELPQEIQEYRVRVIEQMPTLKRILLARGWTLKNKIEKHFSIGWPPHGQDTYYIQSPTRKSPDVHADNEDEAWIKAHKYLPDYFTDLNAIMELVEDLANSRKSGRSYYRPGAILTKLLRRDFKSIIDEWLVHNE